MYIQYDVSVMSNDDTVIYYPLDTKAEAQVVFDSLKMVVKSGQLKEVRLVTAVFNVDADGTHILTSREEQVCGDDEPQPKKMKYIVQERTPNPYTTFEFEESSDRHAAFFIKTMLISNEKYRRLEIESIDVRTGDNETIYTLRGCSRKWWTTFSWPLMLSIQP